MDFALYEAGKNCSLLFARVCVCVCFFVRLRISPRRIKREAVHRRRRQGISHFEELCSPEAQNRTNRLGRIARVARVMAAQRAYASTVQKHTQNYKNKQTNSSRYIHILPIGMCR